jgi:hypothetical protein
LDDDNRHRTGLENGVENGPLLDVRRETELPVDRADDVSQVAGLKQKQVAHFVYTWRITLTDEREVHACAGTRADHQGRLLEHERPKVAGFQRMHVVENE